MFRRDAMPQGAAQLSLMASPAVHPLWPRRPEGRVRVAGKFFSCGPSKWYCKGLTYGPFAPDGNGFFIPDRTRAVNDLRAIAGLGANVIRLYHVPPRWFVHEAAEAGLRLFIDIPWQKHRCFFEDWSARREALDRVARTAAELGNEPSVFALSVANEIPKDVVRFYGRRRVEQFLGELIRAGRQQAPQCLFTYTNYPSTEFLDPAEVDFRCFNVYLEQPQPWETYLDRLQTLSGALPLVLGEYGLDSYRHGEAGQAGGLRRQMSAAYCKGVAGAFVFAYTDDWYTGGHAVDDWAFGITRRDRSPKPAAAALSELWAQVPQGDDISDHPKVSVVVCSYNGAATLDECLRSLIDLDYPRYEVILVDDGSTDDTRDIAANYPQVRYIHQENMGLSVARNVGAKAATGEIVAYTDSDCVADDQWLRYLVTAMRDQQVQAMGGPNVPPTNDRWVAKCVAASPGGPSHVMLDDRYAEHVPGCNMAFDRSKLLELGGFDPQFRVAGDDVDICWRFMEAGMKIGYAPAALVWHHRRATAGAYLRQQRGYGRAEAMLQFKHPHRFDAMGRARWHGIIYGEGAVGLPLESERTYHGVFGLAPFQIVYRHNYYSRWAYCTLLEWHALAAVMLVSALAWHPLVVAAVLMWLLSLVAAARSCAAAPLPEGAPRWARSLVFALHLVQPVVRGWQRYVYRARRRAETKPVPDVEASESVVKRIGPGTWDLYWRSRDGVGREQLLESVVRIARQDGRPGIYDAEWERWDGCLLPDPWHAVKIYTATEELGGGKRFTRARCVLSAGGALRAAAVAAGVFTAAAAIGMRPWALCVAGAVWMTLGAVRLWSGRRCLRAAAGLLAVAARAVRLEPVPVARPAIARSCEPQSNAEPEPAGLLPG